MILLVAFAFIAGIVTILSPCILPILPIVLTSSIGGQDTGKARPLGVVFGFILSFTFFTLFLSTIVSFSGIPADSLRIFSVIVIGLFGISFLIPQFQKLLEKIFSILARFVPQGNNNRTGFWSGVVLGLSIGLLWTPCVGPILASVISLAITGTVTLNAFFITLSYAIGTATPMFAIMIGGQNLLRRVPWLLANTANIQKGFGVVMILTAIAIYNNYDRAFQTYILQTFPQYGTGLTKFEESDAIRKQLQNTSGQKVKQEDMGKPMFDVLSPKGVQAPELIQGGVWFNSKPLTLQALHGKVVLIDFWTYSCINCQRTLPYLRSWYDKYADKGLVIIGVHAPEFEFEKNADNVQKAINDFDLTYPVMQDNNFATWRAYKNHFWPAKYLIDKEGYVRYTHFGEGKYDETERVIQELLKETGRKDVSVPIDNPEYQNYAQTPETYLGYARLSHFISNEQITRDNLATYTAPSSLKDSQVAYSGLWKVTREYANPQKGAKLFLNFSAEQVFLVMRPIQGEAKVSVFLDGKKESFGDDVVNGVVTVDSDRLYKIIKLQKTGRHILELQFEDNNSQLYAFTFG